MGKKIVLCLIFTLTFILGFNTSTYANEINTKALVKGTKSAILISKDDGDVLSVKANNKKVKVTKKNNVVSFMERNVEKVLL